MDSSEQDCICSISVKLDGKPYHERYSRGGHQLVTSILDLKDIKHTVLYTVKNTSNDVVRFVEYWHGYKRAQVRVCTSDQYNVSEGTVHPLKPGETCWVKVELTASREGGMYLELKMKFSQRGTQFRCMKRIEYDCIEEKKRAVFKLIEQIDPEDDEDEDDELYEDLEIVPFQNPESTCQLESTLELPQYDVERWKVALVRSPHSPEKTAEMKEKMFLGGKPDYDTYGERYCSLLDMEEIQMRKDIYKYTLRRVQLYPNPNPDKYGNQRYRIRIPGLAERRPSVVRGDRFYLAPVPPDGYKYEGQVDDTSQNDAFVVLCAQFEDDIDDVDEYLFRLEFCIDRMSLRIMHRAVEHAGADETLEPVLFPKSGFGILPLKDTSKLIINCFNKKMETNPEQMAAVRHIVAGTSRPAPYLIYGPPGTGKTFTMVEAIKQVCMHFPESKILVCAPQNDAADLIAEQLLDHVSDHSIRRFNAASRYGYAMSDKVRGISYFSRDNPDNILFPKKEELISRQIIVSTLVTSGRLVSAEIVDHFTHIFIDEAGHATEPETVIPFGLLDPNMKKGGQVVLAGDPEQLGAMIRSSLAKQYDYSKSLLERLMADKNGPYTRDDSRSGGFNHRYVTKLLQNFRSHPAILEVPNQLFYKFELIPSAPKEEREKFCGWEHLPVFTMIRYQEDKIGFPLVFNRVDGREEQEPHSPSWYNRHEVLAVKDYVEKLLFHSSIPVRPSDIGIISPYLLQCKKIRQALGAIDVSKLNTLDEEIEDINVGTVERFQGNERDVIIISTVRSQPDMLKEDKKFNLGFVSNRKRFNVAVTRAKSLLIIVGNPEVLCTDENWRRLLEHIINGGGYEGAPLDENALRIDPEHLAMNDLNIQDDGQGASAEGYSHHLMHIDDTFEKKN